MSVNWYWDEDYVGYIDFGEKSSNIIRLYKGNCLLIALSEKDKTYNMFTFFADETHMRRCYGITKEKEYKWEGNPLRAMTQNGIIEPKRIFLNYTKFTRREFQTILDCICTKARNTIVLSSDLKRGEESCLT